MTICNRLARGWGRLYARKLLSVLKWSEYYWNMNGNSSLIPGLWLERTPLRPSGLLRNDSWAELSWLHRLVCDNLESCVWRAGLSGLIYVHVRQLEFSVPWTAWELVCASSAHQLVPCRLPTRISRLWKCTSHCISYRLVVPRSGTQSVTHCANIHAHRRLTASTASC